MGDAAGIGPEIIVKALTLHPDLRDRYLPVVVGDPRALQRAAGVVGSSATVQLVQAPADASEDPAVLPCVAVPCLPADLAYGRLSAAAGEGAFRFIERAVDLAMQGQLDAICTAPLNKEALHMAGHIYPGHTEMLAELTGVGDVVMMLTTGLPNGAVLRVAHVTTHVGLIDAVARVEPQRVLRVVHLAEAALRHTVAGRRVSVAVCGINPHAGEGGLFGHGEEAEKIAPAIEQARSEGLDVQGPLPADSVFFRASRGDFDCVVAMYHDQGHGPVKVLGLEGGVNVTLGLPIIRTSVDHGTAFDIAGQGTADERSLIAALDEAARLAAPRPA